MMAETVFPLLTATAAFLAAHFVLSALPVRRRLAGALGLPRFQIAYSLIAAATFVWMSLAYARAPLIDLWAAPGWTWWVVAAVMLLACILLVCGFLTPNPTAWFGQRYLERDDPAPGIFKVTRHPILWAIALWAAVHIWATGDTSSLIYFGGLGLLALVGMLHIDARRDLAAGPGWERFKARTSALPFAAVLQGRARVGPGEIGWVRIALGVAVFFLLMYAHEWVIGVIVAPWEGPVAPYG